MRLASLDGELLLRLAVPALLLATSLVLLALATVDRIFHLYSRHTAHLLLACGAAAWLLAMGWSAIIDPDAGGATGR